MNKLERKLLEEISQCTKCKFCISSCPLYTGWIREGATGKLQSIYYAIKYNLPIDTSLRDILFSCTTCSSCQITCEKYSTGTTSISAIEKARRLLVNRNIGPMPVQKQFSTHIEKEFNPYMERHANRLDWLSRKQRAELPKKAEYVYFVGCTSSYRQKKIAQDTYKVLKALNLDFTVLKDEWCCGSPLLRTGQWDFVKKLANHNIAEINNARAEKVITSCAGCYRTFKKDYSLDYHTYLNTTYNFQILHLTELLDQALQKGKIKLNRFDKRVTYHDPCHLGLHMSVYDAPRNVLHHIPGVDLREMPRNRDNSVCCGAGGGYRSSFPEASVNLSINRLNEAKNVSAEILSTACPFCWRNLSDAIKKTKSKIQIKDIVELVAENIKI